MSESYLSVAMIPIMMAVVLGYYAARLLMFHDAESITGDKAGKLKDKEKYIQESGKLIIFMAVGSAVMALVLYFNIYAAIAEIAIWFLVFGILWKRMNDKYGTTQDRSKNKKKKK